MPVIWPMFIKDLAGDIMNGAAEKEFTKPGGFGSMIGMPKPKMGPAHIKGKLLDASEGPKTIGLGAAAPPIGNPANAALQTNPATFVNSANLSPKSGRYDFGVRVAERYIEAVKGKAQTHVGEMHTNNGAAELLLKEGYGWAFERLLMEGDIPLQDQYDEDGNLIEMGKESHPAYADFCPEFEPPTDEDLANLAKENDKAFDQFIEVGIDEYDLKKFKFYHFPCLSGSETQQELEVIFANRILMGYQFMPNASERWNYFVWACHLGGENYANTSSWNADSNYKNINSKARNDIEDAGYDWKLLADNVSQYVKEGIMAAHPARESDFNRVGTNSTLETRIKRTAEADILFPKINDESGKDVTPAVCPINEYKIQVARDFEGDESLKPKILTMNVIATFTYYKGKKQGGVGGGYVTDNEEGKFVDNGPQNIRFEKSNSWVKQKYEKDEYEKKWRKVPKSKLIAASKKANAQAAFFKIDPKPWGTLFKFEYHRAKCAKKKAEECEEDLAEVMHPWKPSFKGYAGDPYMMMARVTIAYWYACLVKPFKNVPAAPPALIPAPLTGIYIPIYYGSANRLANNLRRAWNTGKTFSKLPATQPPAFAVSTAVAGAYALHLLEFKLLYLGGIPTPAGPVPMVGFVPIVF